MLKMSWFSPSFLPDIFKKKVCRYLLQRYLGQFLEEKLTLEQLNVDITNGTGSVSDVTLYCQINCCHGLQRLLKEEQKLRRKSEGLGHQSSSSEALNELCETHEWGIEVIGGRIGSVTVTVPWNALMTDDSFIHVTDLHIVLKPHIRPKDETTSMLESVWSSMSSSMQLAQECLEKEDGLASAQSNVMEGLERFAQTIDNVLNRVKARLTNTEIRLEYLPPDSDRGIAIIIKITNIEYQNEAGNDPPDKENLSDDENAETSNNIKQKYILISTYAIHNIVMEGITFYSEEFRVHLGENKNTPVNEQSCMMTNDQFFSTISTLPDNEEFYKNTQSSGKDDTNSNESEDCDNDSEIEIFHTDPIQIGKLLGKQEIRIKMKQADTVPGPKVQLEVSLGTVSLFLSPRQLHLVLALCDVLLSDGIVNDDVSPPSNMEHSNMQPSPMDIDFKKFGLRKFNAMSGEIGLNQGWSSENCGDLYDNTEFNTSSHMGLSESVMSTNSSMTSSMVSSTSNYTQNSRKSRRRQIDLDSNADISNFTIQIGCLTLILLHEDILMECSSPLAETPLSDTSVQTLKLKANNYFNKIGFVKIGLGANDIANLMQIMDEACNSHHLRLIAGPIIIDGQDQRNSNGIQLKISNSIGRLDLREVLNDVYVPLLNFPRDRHDNQQMRPDVIVNFLQLQKAIRGSTSRKFAPPKLDVNFSLSGCQIEFDISIIDRISGIINPSPFPSKVGSGGVQKSNENAFSINIESTSLDLKLRFPIADLRPIHDPQRVPWWERNVRPDYLLLTLQQIKINTNSALKYELTSNEINFYYCENEHSADIHLGQTKLQEITGTRFKPSLIEYPKCILEFITETKINNKKSKCDELNSENIGIDSKMDATPFTSKRICRESDTPHNKSSDDETEPLLIPGDATEMENFCNSAMKNSKIQLNIYLPVISLQLKSKHIYEVLYNRVNSDLIMWESRAPNFTPSNQQQTPTSHSLLNVGMMDSIYMPFNMCTSELNCESSSSTNSESESENDIYYSIVDKKNIKRPLAAATSQRETNNMLAFRLNVNQGVISMYTPVRDSQNHVIPGQLGEFLMKFKTAYVFSVAGYQGNENLGYFCLQAKEAELYHCGLIPAPSEEQQLYTMSSIIPPYLQSTMYPTPKNLVQKEMKGSGDRGMVSLAVQIKANPDQRRKKIKVTAGIQLATLRHYFTASQYTWLTQLTDMFDVVDYPVQGYTPYNVLTELHLHIWDCAIDYRPLYFNYRTILTVGTFMISSNIVTSSTGCTLRFVAEDCTLSLAPQSVSIKSKQRNSTENNKITALPMEDLVCIVDLGLLEISLRLNEKATSAFPKLDLRTSISDIHIRTCSDSGRALAQFIAYIAAEGDLEEIDDELSRQSDTMSITSENESDLLSVKSSTTNIPEVTHSQQQRVNSLMADAMEESLRIQTAANTEDVTPITEGVEIFFFPDETNMKLLQQKQIAEPENQIKSDSNDGLSDSVESIEDFKKKNLKQMPSTSEFDDDSFTNMFGREATGDNDSINTEIRELLDFETSVMSMKPSTDSGTVEVIPQVSRDLGDITQITANTRKDPATVAKSRKISSDTDDDFCFIAEEEKVDYTGRMQEVPMCEEPIRIVDNHFSLPYGKPDLLQSPKEFPMAVVRYTLCEMSLCWHLYGGHDFLTDEEKRNKSKSDRTRPVSRYHTLPMSEAYKMGVSFSKGSPKVHIGGVFEKLTWKTKGGDERKHEVLMEIQINKVRFSHETYPSYTEQASRQVLLVTELEIRDRLEVSNINKFLYHPAVGPKAKHGSRHMVVLKALHLRPDPTLPAQECCLRISLLPLRLNIDQDSLEFLVTFFTDLGGDDTEEPTSAKPQNTPSHQPPVMMVEIPEAAQELQARKMVSENLLLLMEEEDSKTSDPIETSSEISTDSSPIYFRNIIFGPEVPIRLDYHGKRVEFNRGPLAGLIMGLGQLQCSEIKLKPISHRHGILGVDRLLNFMLKDWLHDIKRNQLPSILSGVGPMHSLVQLFQGIRDLFWLPIEQYQKDGRIVRGLQLGAQSFTARTALAALEITTRIIHLLQITAETAYDMVSPGPSVRRSRGNRKGKRKRFNPPQDIREGVASAYQIVKEGIGETAHQIVEVAALEHDQKGYTGAIGAVVRQIPPTVVRPIVLATQATSKVLGGVRNQLVPDARTEAKEKWKDDEDE